MSPENKYSKILDEYAEDHQDDPIICKLNSLSEEKRGEILRNFGIDNPEDIGQSRDKIMEAIQIAPEVLEDYPHEKKWRMQLAYLLRKSELGDIGIDLRGNQLTAIEELANFLENEPDSSGYFVQPTGAGKTFLFGIIAKLLGLRTVILVPKTILINQTKDELIKELGFTEDQVGIIEPGKPVPQGKQVVISTYSSHIAGMKKKKHYYHIAKSSPLMICDEAHRAIGDETIKRIGEIDDVITEDEERDEIEVMKNLIRYSAKDALRLGFTATPEMAEKNVGNYFGTQIASESVDDMIKAGILVPPKFHQIDAYIKKSENIKKLSTKDESEIIEREDVYEKLQEKWIEAGNELRTKEDPSPLRTVAYCSNTAECEKFVEVAEKNGLKCKMFTHKNAGSTPKAKAKRLAALQEELLSGKIDFIVTVEMLTEGWNCPPINGIMLARPTLSRRVVEQAVGRGLRAQKEFEDEMYEGKTHCHIFEAVWKMRKFRKRAEGIEKEEGATDIRRGKGKGLSKGTVIGITSAEIFGKEYRLNDDGNKVECRDIFEVDEKGIGKVNNKEVVFMRQYLKSMPGVDLGLVRKYMKRAKLSLIAHKLSEGQVVLSGGKTYTTDKLYNKNSVDRVISKIYANVNIDSNGIGVKINFFDLKKGSVDAVDVVDLTPYCEYLLRTKGIATSHRDLIDLISKIKPELSSIHISFSNLKGNTGDSVYLRSEVDSKLEQFIKEGADFKLLREPASEQSQKKTPLELANAPKKAQTAEKIEEKKWTINEVSFTLPVRDPRAIYGAFGKDIPELKNKFSSSLSTPGEFESILRGEYMAEISKNCSLEGDDYTHMIRNLEYKINQIFEKGSDQRYALQHHSN